ncbi:MAG: transcription termination factor NusA, partial [Myxococcota bacterium]
QHRATEMVTGIVRRFEKGNVIVDLGRADAILPRREQTPRESYRPGDRIMAMIKEVQRSSRDPQVVLTRADPAMLFELFEMEVPEIHEDIVRIVAVAREPGVRSKVAVYSRDSDVDPVGACVGMRGSRVQAVVQELRGEKIDIVPYVEDSARFVCNAISPAEVHKVLIDEMAMTMELIVPDDQLSLAIGRGGQNVRLAAQLSGWNLDIISETRLKAMMAETRANLLEFEGISEDMIDTLFTLGYNKLEHISQADTQEIAQIPGFSQESALTIIDAAEKILARPKPGSAEAMTPEDEEKAELRKNIRGVGEKIADAMFAANFKTPEDVAFAEIAEFAEAIEVHFKKGRQIWQAAVKFLKSSTDLTEENFEERKAAFLSAKQAEEAEEDGGSEPAPQEEQATTQQQELAGAEAELSEDASGDDEHGEVEFAAKIIAPPDQEITERIEAAAALEAAAEAEVQDAEDAVEGQNEGSEE